MTTTPSRSTPCGGRSSTEWGHGCRGSTCRWATRGATAAAGVIAGGRWTPLLDDRAPRDLRARDIFLQAFGSMDFERRPWIVAVATARVVAANPQVIPAAIGFAGRLARRLGIRRLLRGRPRVLTFVVHAFMDAEVVGPAWEAMQRGEVAGDERVRAAQERLQACSYAMAHPAEDRLVPACVQHSVLDPQENAALKRLLPLRETTAS